MLKIIRIIFIAIALLLTLIYAITSIFLRRHVHIFIINVCLTIMFAGVYWLIDIIFLQNYVTNQVNDNLCTIIFYARMVCSCQMSFAFVVVAINRLLYIIYSKRAFFKKNSWIAICICIQLITGFIAPLLLLSKKLSVRVSYSLFKSSKP